jgi:hypothetical protein
MDQSGQAPWVADVRTTADRLDGELMRCADGDSPDRTIVGDALARARRLADQPELAGAGHLRGLRRCSHRMGSWCTGTEVDQAWASLHMAGQALLEIEDQEVVKSQLGDMAAATVTSLNVGDMRVKDYLATLQLLARADRPITGADRAQLRAIRQACDSSSDGGHADARSYRNTLMTVGLLLAVVLALLAGLAAVDDTFRSVFDADTGIWYVLELEVVGSLAGVTGGLFALSNYSGFQSSYGLPLVQVFLKGSAGAATGLLGVLLVQSGIVSSFRPQTKSGVFAVAIFFGYTQYLFTRLVDQQAQAVLNAASSRNQPSTTPKAPSGSDSLPLLTTKQSS